MTTGQYNRRNFLSSIAILSAGTALGSGIKYFTPPGVAYLNDLQKKWMEFWKRSGGQVFHGMINHDIINYNKETKGHFYEYGQVIYFPAENILARPTWIFWNNSAKPADVVINLI